MNLAEEFGALFDGETALTEDFKTKLATVFEAVVTQRVKEKIEEAQSELEEKFEKQLEEQVESVVEELVDSVDGYLNLAIEKWVSDNAIALESGVRASIAESLLEGVFRVFADHNVTVPEGKEDLVESLGVRVRELEKKLDETYHAAAMYKRKVDEYAKEFVIREQCNGLSEMQSEKLRALAENIGYDEQFATKLSVLRESLFSNTNTIAEQQQPDVKTPAFIAEQSEPVQEEVVNESKDHDTDPEIKRYLETISLLSRVQKS